MTSVHETNFAHKHPIYCLRVLSGVVVKCRRKPQPNIPFGKEGSSSFLPSFSKQQQASSTPWREQRQSASLRVSHLHSSIKRHSFLNSQFQSSRNTDMQQARSQQPKASFGRPQLGEMTLILFKMKMSQVMGCLFVMSLSRLDMLRKPRSSRGNRSRW
jgi:hypothetical protein